MQLTSSWAALLCTKWMFSFRLCWGWREDGQRRSPHSSAKTPPAGSELWGAQASTPRTFPTPASLTSGPEKLICISLSSSLSL